MGYFLPRAADSLLPGVSFLKNRRQRYNNSSIRL